MLSGLRFEAIFFLSWISNFDGFFKLFNKEATWLFDLKKVALGGSLFTSTILGSSIAEGEFANKIIKNKR